MRRYGYITNTKNKLIVVVDDYDVKELDIKSVRLSCNVHPTSKLAHAA